MIGVALQTSLRNLGEENIIEHKSAHSSPRCLSAEWEKTPLNSERAQTMKMKATNGRCCAARVTVDVLLAFTGMCGTFVLG
jgi:hypothetical protein